MVDAGSGDATAEFVRAGAGGVLIGPRGGALQTNARAVVAMGEALWFLRADTVASPDVQDLCGDCGIYLVYPRERAGEPRIRAFRDRVLDQLRAEGEPPDA